MRQPYWIDWESFEDSSYFNGTLNPEVPVRIMKDYPIFHDEHMIEVAVVDQKTKSGHLRGIIIPTAFLIPVKEELISG